MSKLKKNLRRVAPTALSMLLGGCSGFFVLGGQTSEAPTPIGRQPNTPAVTMSSPTIGQPLDEPQMTTITTSVPPPATIGIGF